MIPISAHDTLILRVADTYNLDYDLLRAQVDVESAGDAWAFRYEPAFFERYIRNRPTVAGARYGPLAACSFGLMQIVLETAIELGFDESPERLFDPRVGLAFGAKYLQKCIARADGSYRIGLEHYNGAGHAARLYALRVMERAGRETT